MQPLSGLDAAFLYLETPRTPMHVAGLSIFARTGDGARLEFATFRAHVAARVHLVRTYRERLVMVPLGLGKPYRIDDPDFDLDLHLHHVKLPSPVRGMTCATCLLPWSAAPSTAQGRCGR